MSTQQSTAMTDLFDLGARLTAPQRLSSLHVEALGPSARATCTACGHTIHARPLFSGPGSCRYILPIDEQGRCPTCVWVEAPVK